MSIASPGLCSCPGRIRSSFSWQVGGGWCRQRRMDAPFAKRKRGRPRKPPQTMPIFMGPWPDRRVAVRVVISGFAVGELRRYVHWASELTKLDETETLYRALDSAILDLTRRDTLWRKVRARIMNEEARAAILGLPEAEPPAAEPPFLDEPTLVTK